MYTSAKTPRGHCFGGSLESGSGPPIYKATDPYSANIKFDYTVVRHGGIRRGVTKLLEYEAVLQDQIGD